MARVYEAPEMKIILGPRDGGYPAILQAVQQNEPVDVFGVTWFIQSAKTLNASISGPIEVTLREAVSVPPETDQSLRTRLMAHIAPMLIGKVPPTAIVAALTGCGADLDAAAEAMGIEGRFGVTRT